MKTENISLPDYINSIKNSIFFNYIDSKEVKNITVTLKIGHNNIKLLKQLTV